MEFIKKHLKKTLYAAAFAFLVLAVVFTCVFLYNKQFNEKIQGSPYAPIELGFPPVPTPEQKKEPMPAGRYNTEVIGQKTVYLTFDDGPSLVTPMILDVLKAENVKATFFVLGTEAEKHPDIIARTASEGHKIANHSYSHDYKSLYDESDFFINDVLKTERLITSLAPDAYEKVFRFPGGSFEDYKWEKFDILIENDYCFVDWNCSNGDAEALNKPPEELILETIETSAGRNTAVLLMHDSSSKETTAAALGDIIRFFKENGYTFAVFER